MPTVLVDDIDQLNAVMTVTIAKEDYEPKLSEEFKKLRQKGSFKGFRKGKTPSTFIKKMYGKQALQDMVMKMLEEEVSKAFYDENQNYIGQPMPADDSEPFDFDVNDLKDYEFRFQVGKAPQFEVQMPGDGDTFNIYKLQVPEDKVEERLDFIRKRKGEQGDTDDFIQEDDIIYFNASELDGDSLKEDGWKTTFSMAADRIADEKLSEELKEKKKGDTVRFNIYELELDAKTDYVKKYLLNFTEADIEEGTETGEMYEATIEKVTRLVPAELTQEIYDEVFGEGVVTNEEEAKDIIRQNMASQDGGAGDTLLYNDLRKHLLATNKEAVALPEEFLKKWVMIAHTKDSKNILENFDKFIEDTQWSLIKGKLLRQFEITVNDDEIRQLAIQRVAGYFGGYSNKQIIESVVSQMLKEKEQVENLAQDVLNDKLFRALKDSISLNEIAISDKEMDEKFEAFDAEMKASRYMGNDEDASEEE